MADIQLASLNNLPLAARKATTPMRQTSDGSEGTVWASRDGALMTMDWYTAMAMEGRVFNISNEVQEGGATALCGETAPGTDNINPSILIDVPSGVTIIPMEVMVMPEGTGTQGDWGVIRINTDDTTRYSSGGNALPIINMRKDDIHASACSAYDGSTQIVASANTDDDIIWVGSTDHSARANEAQIWTARQFIPPILVGPASLLVFIMVTTVDEEILFSAKWVELPSNTIV
jgi:hypothetical protein